MRKLPEAEQELMMIIWDAEEPISRAEIEERMDGSKDVVPSTILTLLSRLEERGFVRREKRGKINFYSSLVEKEPYLKETGKQMLQKLFKGSLSNFAAALYEDEELSKNDIQELQKFLDSKMGEK